MAQVVQDFVQVNKYTRPGKKNNGIKGIVMHWTATPGASAKNERDYFNGTCITQKRYASAHYFVDKNEIRQAIPENEIAYHAHDNSRCNVPFLAPDANYTAIGIEMCVEKDGSINPTTVANAVQLVVSLCKKYGFGADKIVRHYDVTGKNCPAPWVSNSALLEQFKQSVDSTIKGSQVVQTPPPVQPVPEAPKAGSVVIGKVRTIVSDLRIRKGPGTNYPVVREAAKGEEFDVYANVNDWHNVGGENWVFGNNGEYLELVRDTPAPQPAPKPQPAPQPVKAVIPFPGVLKEGSRGEEVKRVQRALGITADGIFGKGTKASVAAYQGRHGLTADGIVGPATWGTIF